jgi:hypothetical protein
LKGLALLTPAERRLRSQIAAHTLHSRYDSTQLTSNGRAAFLAKFEQEVDPERALPDGERRRRAEHARKAYFKRLRLKRGTSPRRKALKSGPALAERGRSEVRDDSADLP